MARRYDSTILPSAPGLAANQEAELRKAFLDMLDKVNAVSGDIPANAGPYYPVGYKYGLTLSYVSSDNISLSTGSVQHYNAGNSTLVTKAAATTLTPSTPNFPSAGAWAYVGISATGSIALWSATGTAAQRPTDSYFSTLSNGGYYNTVSNVSYRIIGALLKISATSFTFSNLANGSDETGNGLSGGILYGWQRVGKNQTCWVEDQNNTPNVGAGVIYTSTYTWPVAFVTYPPCVSAGMVPTVVYACSGYATNNNSLVNTTHAINNGATLQQFYNRTVIGIGLFS